MPRSNATDQLVQPDHLFVDIALRAKITMKRLRSGVGRARILATLTARTRTSRDGGACGHRTVGGDTRDALGDDALGCRAVLNPRDVSAFRFSAARWHVSCRHTILGRANLCSVGTFDALDACNPLLGFAVEVRRGTNAFRSFTTVSSQRRHSDDFGPRVDTSSRGRLRLLASIIAGARHLPETILALNRFFEISPLRPYKPKHLDWCST